MGARHYSAKKTVPLDTLYFTQSIRVFLKWLPTVSNDLYKISKQMASQDAIKFAKCSVNMPIVEVQTALLRDEYWK